MPGHDTDAHILPADLPVPEDDGAARHLVGLPMPDLALPATTGEQIRLSRLSGRTVVYIYPLTARPDSVMPSDWDEIPGARGCTPQSCSFRDHHAALHALGARVFGLSTQRTPYQQEVVARLHLPYPLLSDADLTLTRALHLPTFQVEGAPAGEASTLLRRLTLILRDGHVEHVFYPVFPPDRNAQEVLTWLDSVRARS